MEWYLKVVRDNYSNFEGRARRKEYWMFVLVNFLIALAISVVIGVISETLASGLGLLYGLAVFLPALAVSVRRLHDTGKSGWLLLLSFIPALGLIILIIFLAIDSTPGENEYGPNPKGL